MKALLTLVMMMMMMMMMAASEPTGEKGLRGCPDGSPFNFNPRDVFGLKLALTQCSEPRTLEFCQSQLDKCGQILSKVHGEIDDQTFKALPGIIHECSALFHAHINVEKFPSTLAELRERCFTLDELAGKGVSMVKAFPLFRCIAYKLDPDQMDRFTACINGLE